MKKLKKIWQENSVILVLFIILIACLVAISVVVVKYFIGDSSSNYRLEDVDKHPFTEEAQNEIITKIKDDKLVLDAKIIVSNKSPRIDVKINFDSSVTLVEAQSKALSSLEYFSEDVLGYYDIQFMIEADATDKTDGFHIMGSHNVSGTGGIVWNNNRVPEPEEDNS